VTRRYGYFSACIAMVAMCAFKAYGIDGAVIPTLCMHIGVTLGLAIGEAVKS
jgi:hypothetical protein